MHRRREKYNRDEEKKWKSEREEKACAQLEMKGKETIR